MSHSKNVSILLIGLLVVGSITPPSTAEEPSVKSASIRFTEINFAIEDLGKSHELKLTHLLPVGPDIDLVCGFGPWKGYGTRVACLMRTPGKLEPHVTFENKRDFGRPCFDGRYAWLPVRGRGFTLLRIDPHDGKVRSLDADDGIPPDGWSSPACLPLAPGRILLYSEHSLREPHSATFVLIDAAGGATARVKPLEVTFTRGERSPAVVGLDDTPIERRLCDFAVVDVSQPGVDAARSIVIGRPKSERRKAPLLAFDHADFRPDAPAGAKPIHSFGDAQLDGGAAYWLSDDEIWRFGPEDPYAVSIAAAPETEQLVVDGSRALLLGAQCWYAENVFQPFHPLRMNRPPFPRPELHQVHHSAIYGRILQASEGEWKLYQYAVE